MSYTRVVAGMRNFWLNIPRAVSAVRALELSREAKHRLRMMMWYDEHGRNAALTCRHFGISRDTFYRWLRRFQQFGPGGLENGRHRPKNVRKPTWTRDLENAVLELRRLTPGWGKDKLVVLLGDQSLEYFETPWPMPLKVHAQILRSMLSYKPKAVLADFLFIDDRQEHPGQSAEGVEYLQKVVDRYDRRNIPLYMLGNHKDPRAPFHSGRIRDVSDEDEEGKKRFAMLGPR